MQQATGTSAETLLNKDILQINSGSVAEQFVGQQLRTLQPIFEQHKLFYWCRENKNSSAEIDYVIAMDDKILPIEVKAGSTGKLKSLRIYLEEKTTDYGIRISLDSLSFYDHILTVPMYMIHEIPRLIKLKDSS